MAADFAFISPTDRPALLAISQNEWRGHARAALEQLGYKTHEIETHDQFQSRFGQIQYQVLVIEDQFACAPGAANQTLLAVQNLPMNQRRNTTIFLIGMNFKTLDGLQAYQQSVHAVIHPSEFGSLPQIFQTVIADTEGFLSTFRDVHLQMSQGRVR